MTWPPQCPNPGESSHRRTVPVARSACSWCRKSCENEESARTVVFQDECCGCRRCLVTAGDSDQPASERRRQLQVRHRTSLQPGGYLSRVLRQGAACGGFRFRAKEKRRSDIDSPCEMFSGPS